MADILQQIVQFLEAAIHAVGYPGIFLVMFAENIFTPIPTEPFLPLAGMLAADERMTFLGVWLAAGLGAVTGSLVIYLVGRYAGEPAVRQLLRRFGRYLGISERELDRGIALFNRYGAPLVFFGRLIPVVRPTISIVSGITRLPLPVFLLFTALSSSLVNAFWVAVGYFLGENWEAVLGTFDQLQPILLPVIVVAALAAVIVIGWRLLRRRGAHAPIPESE